MRLPQSFGGDVAGVGGCNGDTRSAASYWAGSEARPTGREPGIEREREALLRNRHGHWQLEKRDRTANEF